MHRELGQHEEALRLLKQALPIRLEALGDKHPDYATSLNNLATVVHMRSWASMREALHCGCNKQALALAIRLEALGDKHPDYASSLNNLAGVHMCTWEAGPA